MSKDSFHPTNLPLTIPIFLERIWHESEKYDDNPIKTIIELCHSARMDKTLIDEVISSFRYYGENNLYNLRSHYKELYPSHWLETIAQYGHETSVHSPDESISDAIGEIAQNGSEISGDPSDPPRELETICALPTKIAIAPFYFSMILPDISRKQSKDEIELLKNSLQDLIKFQNGRFIGVELAYGFSVAHVAAAFSLVDILKQLPSVLLFPEEKEDSYPSPYNYALINANLATVKFFVTNGQNTSQEDIELACENHNNLEVLTHFCEDLKINVDFKMIQNKMRTMPLEMFKYLINLPSFSAASNLPIFSLLLIRVNPDVEEKIQILLSKSNLCFNYDYDSNLYWGLLIKSGFLSQIMARAEMTDEMRLEGLFDCVLEIEPEAFKVIYSSLESQNLSNDLFNKVILRALRYPQAKEMLVILFSEENLAIDWAEIFSKTFDKYLDSKPEYFEDVIKLLINAAKKAGSKNLEMTFAPILEVKSDAPYFEKLSALERSLILIIDDETSLCGDNSVLELIV